MLDARQKGVLDLYYRLLTGTVPASDLSGTVPEGNLPAFVTPTQLTDAIAAIDMSPIKSIQRGYKVVAAGATEVVTINAVDPDKSILLIVVASNNQNPVISASLTDVTSFTLVHREASMGGNQYVNWQVVEYK